MAAEHPTDLKLEIAHLLLMDIVGYSKLLVNEQIECVQALNRIVRNTARFRAAEAEGKLLRVATGDGMALLFYNSLEEPVQCALEISAAVQDKPELPLRMGVHSGPVTRLNDVNDRSNVAGSGINTAQRVMDCGDAGHILLSKHIADDLAQYRHWQPYLHDLGQCEVKHGVRIGIFNLHKPPFGNPAVPQKLRRRWQGGGRTREVRAVSPSKWPAAAVAAAILFSLAAVAVSITVLFRPETMRWKPGSVAPTKSIAVLPFASLSDQKQDVFFTEGVQDEILTDLAKVADLKVISRTSVMQYTGGTPRNLRDVAATLGVSHVLEGTVQIVSGRVRVSAQLIDARTDHHVWAERYERDIADVFAIQAEIAEKIVEQLEAKLSPREKAAIEDTPTADLTAYDFYIRAKDLIAQSISDENRQEGLSEAVRLLDRAIARDAAFALAYYELAHAHDQIYLSGIDHTPARAALTEAAVGTLQRLRPNSGEAHLALARHLYWCYRDYDRALVELRAAKKLLPNDPIVALLQGYIDRRQGRWDKAEKNLQRASELDPRNLTILHQIALTYQSLRRFADCAATLDRALRLAPHDLTTLERRAQVEVDWRADTNPLKDLVGRLQRESPATLEHLGEARLDLAFMERDPAEAERALAVMGADGCHSESIPFPRAWCAAQVARLRGDDAAARRACEAGRAEIAEIVRAQPEYAEAYCALGVIDAALGRHDEAIAEGRRAIAMLPVSQDAINGPLLVGYLAFIYASLGENDRAFEQLTNATSIPSYFSYGDLRLHPRWDPLRSDPRFEQLLARLAPK